MRDVAERAGVSTSTVSHVINGTRFVTGDLAERVRAAMAELGYQPNAVARSLRRKETLTLGMVLPDSANPFFAAMARAVDDACFQQGYSLILANSAGDSDRELRNLNMLLARQCDGLIFAAAGLGSAERLRVVGTAPVVIVDRELPPPPGLPGQAVVAGADTVMVDNLGGGYQAARHLLELGHTRIACITGPSDVTPSAERVTGFRRALNEAGVEIDETLLVRGDFAYEGGYLGARQLVQRPRPPTAVFACNDLMAIGAIAGASELGCKLPRDLSIVGFDDITPASFSAPALTTIHQPIAQIGRLAADLLLRRIADPQTAPQHHVLLTELVVRKSTAHPGAAPS